MNISVTPVSPTDLSAATVVAVVVSYEPALDALDRLLRSILQQVATVWIVDNGSAADVSGWVERQGSAKLRCLRLPENLGVAAAQNRGIEKARQAGTEFVLLLDQDSGPAPDMVDRLLAAVRARQAEGIQVGAVGPLCIDQRNGRPQAFVQLRGIFYRRVRCRDAQEAIETNDLIASGCLIPMSVLDTVGDMTEPLFIDYVDTEWSLRARRHGYRLFGVCAARMEHALGDAGVDLPGRRVALHSPLRHYYMFRNAIWLARRRDVATSWKVADGLRLLQRFVFYALCARPRTEHLRMMLRGMSDGWRGRMGRFDDRR
jgi:rhamnosyltransferase